MLLCSWHRDGAFSKDSKPKHLVAMIYFDAVEQSGGATVSGDEHRFTLVFEHIGTNGVPVVRHLFCLYINWMCTCRL